VRVFELLTLLRPVSDRDHDSQDQPMLAGDAATNSELKKGNHTMPDTKARLTALWLFAG
jgi:hypothetical protein